MSAPDPLVTQSNRGATAIAVVSAIIAIISVMVATVAILLAQRAVDAAEVAERRIDQTIERQRTMLGEATSSERRQDPRAAFLDSIANRRDELDEGLDGWATSYERYRFAPPETQYRAFASFFDAYPLTTQYFYFLNREEARRGEEIRLSNAERQLFEGFRYWLQLRSSFSP